MDFTLDDDRQMLAETLRRFLADAWDVESRADAAYRHPFHKPEAYKGLVEMGVLGVLVDEDAGGFGGSGLDVMVMFEEVGRTLAPEPLLPTLLAVRLLAGVGDHDLLGQVVAGEVRPVVALVEPHDVDAVTELETVATEADDSWTVAGRKSTVWGGPGADVALVTAMVNATVGLFEVDLADAATTDYALVDGGGASEVELDDTPARLVAADVGDVLSDALDAGRLALCAEAVGAMDHLFDLTTDFLSSREQFGQPLARFQALQHRVVDLSIELEQARSITILAADSLGGAKGQRNVAMAKHKVGCVARLVAEEAIQLHGGIGMTWEYPGAHYAKRLVMLDAQLGDADLQLRRLVEDLAV